MTDTDARVLNYDPDIIGRLAPVVYAIKWVQKDSEGKRRTNVYLFASKPQYDLWKERVLGNWNGLYEGVGSIEFWKGGVEWWKAESG